MKRLLLKAVLCMLGLAVLSTVLWIWNSARVHTVREIAGLYREYADGYDSATDFQDGDFSSCYGQQWDRFSERIRVDIQQHSVDRSYRSKKAVRYRQLSQDYRRALSHLFPRISLDPPFKP